LFNASFCDDLFPIHHRNIAESNGWTILLFPLMVYKPPNHHGVIANPYILIGNPRLCNEHIETDDGDLHILK